MPWKESSVMDERMRFVIPLRDGESMAARAGNGEAARCILMASRAAKMAILVKTAGKPAKLRLKVGRAPIGGNRNDVSFVTLEVLDQSGEVVPDAVVRPKGGSGSAAVRAEAAGLSPASVVVHVG